MIRFNIILSNILYPEIYAFLLIYGKITVMCDQTISELLILFIILYSLLRIFFKTKFKADSIAILPVVALTFSILSILAWGITQIELVIFILAFFNTIWNFRAIIRLKARLIVDQYSILFILVSLLNIVLTLGMAVIIFVNRPVRCEPKKYGVSMSEYYYKGSFEKGFTQYQKGFGYPAVKIRCYNPEEYYADQRVTLFFIPEKSTSIRTYEPYLIKLSQCGYTVYAAEFFSPDRTYSGKIKDISLLRSFVLHLKQLSSAEEYETLFKTKKFYLAEEYTTLASLAGTISVKGDFIFIGDKIQAKGFDIPQTGINAPSLTIDLSKMNGYTSAGFGPVEQTDPLTGRFLGLKRDHSMYMSAHLAKETEALVKDYIYKVNYGD